MIYLDTSLIVALFTSEPGSAAAQAWAKAQGDESLAISAWVSAEVASALSIKVRSGVLTVPQRAVIAMNWRQFREGLMNLAIETAALNKAELWADRHELGLRAADALHVAIAAGYGASIATLDRRMRGAAEELGVPVADI